MTRHDSCQVSPFGHPGITARLTAPPGLSRPPTSFIGSWCQGIHRPPLTTYTHQKPATHRVETPCHGLRRPQKTKMLASTIQFSTHNQPTTTTPTPAPNPQPQQNHNDLDGM